MDGDSLSYQWHLYPEAGGYEGQIDIVAPDDGIPALTRYRRLVVAVP
ncbi:MAG: hypothetical protein AB8B91_13070 [Rubripirellula sp.]